MLPLKLLSCSCQCIRVLWPAVHSQTHDTSAARSLQEHLVLLRAEQLLFHCSLTKKFLHLIISPTQILITGVFSTLSSGWQGDNHPLTSGVANHQIWFVACAATSYGVMWCTSALPASMCEWERDCILFMRVNLNGSQQMFNSPWCSTFTVTLWRQQTLYH